MPSQKYSEYLIKYLGVHGLVKLTQKINHRSFPETYTSNYLFNLSTLTYHRSLKCNASKIYCVIFLFKFILRVSIPEHYKMTACTLNDLYQNPRTIFYASFSHIPQNHQSGQLPLLPICCRCLFLAMLAYSMRGYWSPAECSQYPQMPDLPRATEA